MTSNKILLILKENLYLACLNMRTMTGVLHVWPKKWEKKIFIKNTLNVRKTTSMCLMVLRDSFAESVWMAIGNHLLIRLQWDVPIHQSSYAYSSRQDTDSLLILEGIKPYFT